MIRDERGIELPLRVVFENPSVRELSILVDKSSAPFNEFQIRL